MCLARCDLRFDYELVNPMFIRSTSDADALKARNVALVATHMFYEAVVASESGAPRRCHPVGPEAPSAPAACIEAGSDSMGCGRVVNLLLEAPLTSHACCP